MRSKQYDMRLLEVFLRRRHFFHLCRNSRQDGHARLSSPATRSDHASHSPPALPWGRWQQSLSLRSQCACPEKPGPCHRIRCSRESQFAYRIPARGFAIALRPEWPGREQSEIIWDGSAPYASAKVNRGEQRWQRNATSSSLTLPKIDTWLTTSADRFTMS